MDSPGNPEVREQLRAAAIEGGRVGTWYWWFDRNQLEWSEICKQYLALPEGELPSLERLHAAIHPEDRANAQQVIGRALEGGVESFCDEHRVVHADGTIRWVSVTGRLQRDVKHCPYAMAGTVIDITDRKEIEGRLQETLRALENSESRFRLAMDAAQEGIWDWQIDSGSVYYSPGYTLMLGYPENQFANEVSTWINLLDPDVADDIVAEAKRLLRDPGHYSLEFRMRHADGAYRWVLSRGKAVQWDAAGNPLRAIGTHTDISQRKADEALLQQTLQRFQHVFEHAPIGISIADLQGTLVQTNSTLARMLGYSNVELVGQPFSFLIHPLDREANLTEVRRLLAGEIATVDIENRYCRKDGSTVWVRKTIACLPNERGERAQLIALVKDISAQRDAEERAAESRHLLELALSGAELGAWDVDVGSGKSIFDERYCAMLGYRKGEIDPSMAGWRRMIHPDDLAEVNEAMRAHLAGETRMYESEHRLRHKDGHWVWVIARGKVSLDAEGRVRRATGTMLDISERKRVADEGAALLRKIEALIGGLGRSAKSSEENAVTKIRLSPRNRDVLALVADGLTAAEIAVRLKISKDTAITHRRDLMRKLGLRNKAELIRFALQNNLTSS